MNEKLTFDYCALAYLNQWIQIESSIANKISENKISWISECLTFFKVARNFPYKNNFDEMSKTERNQIILEVLVNRNIDKENYTQHVYEVDSELQRKFDEKRKLSASTKLLWSYYKSPIIIYDGNARKAIESINEYDDYVHKWENKFKEFENDIHEASSSLLSVKSYLYPNKIDIKSIVNQKWFHARVFDRYLWEKGAAL